MTSTCEHQTFTSEDGNYTFSAPEICYTTDGSEPTIDCTNLSNKIYSSPFNLYEGALAIVLSIPICSKGGEAASKYAQQLYQKNLNRMNLFLLNRARALWAAGQDQNTAYEVCSLLAQIDPDAACYADAAKLMTEVKRQVRSDIDFEMRQKYNDQVKIERERIAAIRAIGVAYGKGQQPTTTNLMFLR